MENVLIIEEEGRAAQALQPLSDEAAWRLTSVGNVEAAELQLRQALFHVMVLDLRVGHDKGEALLSRLHQLSPLSAIVVLSPDLARGLRAQKLGAFDSVVLPVDAEALTAALRRAAEHSRLGLELRAARLREDKQAQLLGQSSATLQLREALIKAGGHDANVLLLGEPGSGKQQAARFLHQNGRRKRGPLVVVACDDIDPSKMEAELFGTAALPGRLEQAAGGTVLLRTVDFLSPDLQAKLLRALQDRTFSPQGSQRMVGLDARILASSTPDLRERVQSGAFREDLFWRLGATPLEIPPLRTRTEDIPDLFLQMLHRRCRALRRQTPVVRPEAVDALRYHRFPGNVAELEALAHLVAALAAEDVGLADLPIPIFVGDDKEKKDLPLKTIVHAFERQIILRTLKAVRNNQSRAAERLDIHRNTLILKMQELDIPNKREVKKKRTKA